ncbi:MAG: HupE/UreJ family protein [Blastocatellia bacterium]
MIKKSAKKNAVVINLIRLGLGSAVSVFCLLLCASGTALAHDPGLSAAEVRIGSERVVVQLSIARSDVEKLIALDLDQAGRAAESELAATLPQLEAFARDSIELWFDGQPAAPIAVEVRLDQTSAIDFRISFARVAGSHLRIRSASIQSLSRGHREHLSVVNDAGNKLGEKMLDAGNDEFELSINVPSNTRASSLVEFLGLGVEHILTGYDHLVFLLGLLLAGAGLRDVAKIITSFTAAHSITLALSTFDLVAIPPGVVEPLIAVSIVYVGLENVLRRDLKWRWLLTFGFGLVHGFGFASALRDLGLGSGAGAALPLLSFNLGVEMGQIAIAAVVLPLIWKLRERPVFVTGYSPVCSIMISLVGGFWLVERLTGGGKPIFPT